MSDSAPFGLDVVDLHIAETVLVSYVRLDAEFMVTFSGGEGYWVDLATATRIEFKDLSDIALTFQYVQPNSDLMAMAIATAAESMEQVFARWQSQGTPLTIVSGPNAPMFLVENEEIWLAVPRKKG